jgi:hypothetical protein
MIGIVGTIAALAAADRYRKHHHGYYGYERPYYGYGGPRYYHGGPYGYHRW